MTHSVSDWVERDGERQKERDREGERKRFESFDGFVSTMHMCGVRWFSYTRMERFSTSEWAFSMWRAASCILALDYGVCFWLENYSQFGYHNNRENYDDREEPSTPRTAWNALGLRVAVASPAGDFASGYASYESFRDHQQMLSTRQRFEYKVDCKL